MSETKRTPMDHEIRMQEANVRFFTEKLDSELRWLESGIADLRREVDRKSIFEQRNLVAKAADVAEVAGKLRSAHEALALLARVVEQTP